MSDQEFTPDFLAFCRKFQLDPGMMKEGLDQMSKAPNYRPSSGEQKCGTCRYFDRGQCTLYNFDASHDYVCDSWSG